MIVLDTHALLWWAMDPDKLSKTAAAHCAEMEQHGGYVSAISFWELGIKIKRRKLDLGIPIEEFARRVESTGVVEAVAVDTALWLRSLSLPWRHRDPADRVIVATAQRLGVPVLTKDQTLRRFSAVETVW